MALGIAITVGVTGFVGDCFIRRIVLGVVCVLRLLECLVFFFVSKGLHASSIIFLFLPLRFLPSGVEVLIAAANEEEDEDEGDSVAVRVPCVCRDAFRLITERVKACIAVWIMSHE